jgi:hypothetical protein
MLLAASRASVVALLLAGGLLGACGGKTLEPVEPTPISAAGPAPDGGPIFRQPPPIDADLPDHSVPVQQCVDIEVTTADLACAVDTDCTYATTGEVCPSNCYCGDTPVNQAAADRINSELPPMAPGIGCACGAPADLRCIQGQCGFGSLDWDAGEPDSGDEDGGLTEGGPDASTCVDVPYSDFSTSCNVPSDCVVILVGQVCDGTCGCVGSPINIAGEPMYDEMIAGITFAECACPGQPAPDCVAGNCVIPQ